MFVLPRGLNIPPDTVVMCNSRPLQLVTSYKYLGVFLDNRLSWEAQILHITRKVSQKIGTLLCAGQQLTLPAKRLFYMAIIVPTLNIVQTPSISLFPPHRRKSLFVSPSVLSEQFSELHRGRPLFPSTSNFKFAAFLNEWTINCFFSLTDARTLSQVLSQQMSSLLLVNQMHAHNQ